MILRSFLRDVRGNFAMTLAIAVIPVVLSAGIAVDYSSVSRQQIHLQNAVDAATLAAGRELASMDNGEIRKVVRKFMRANLDPADFKEIRKTKIKIDRDDKVLEVTATAKMPTNFGPIIGIQHLPYGATASIAMAAGSIEAVLVLDNTGSMSKDGKIDALKSTAGDFINNIIDLAGDGDSTKIGIVPFSEYVNVGTDKSSKSWLDLDHDAAEGECIPDQPMPPTASCSNNIVSVLIDGSSSTGSGLSCAFGGGGFGGGGYGGGSGNAASQGSFCPVTGGIWKGCVGSRQYPNNLKDDGYGERIPAFYGSEKGYEQCPSQLVELTNDKQKLLDTVNAMKATGNTYIPAGLIWGMRVLSSQEPFTQATSKSVAKTKSIQKNLILMTDGENTISKNPDSHIHDGVDYAQADEWTTKLCNSIKKQGISIFTLSFGTSVSSATKNMLQKCASSPNNFFDAQDSGKLADAFGDIADSLAKLYLTK